MSLHNNRIHDLPDRSCNGKICSDRSRCLAFIDHNQVFTMEIIDKSGCRIYNQRCATDNEHISFTDRTDAFLDYFRIQSFFIKDPRMSSHCYKKYAAFLP